MIRDHNELNALPSPTQGVYSSLEEYIRGMRFRDTEILPRIEGELDLCRAQSPSLSKVILIHSPYPDETSEAIVTLQDQDSESSVGEGCGKSDLLDLLQERFREHQGCRVICFMKNRTNVVEGLSFYNDIFLPRLADLDRRLFYTAWDGFARFFQAIWSRMQQFSLLVNAAIPPLLGVVGYILTLLGFKAIEFFADPNNQTFLNQIATSIATFLGQNQALFYSFAVIAFLLWLLHAYGVIQGSEKRLKRWQELGRTKDIDEIVSVRKEQLARNPEKILQRFAGRRRTLVLLIDDVDALGGFSFQSIMGLYRKAEESDKYSVLLIMSYNPRNPALRRHENSAIVREIDSFRYDEQDGMLISLSLSSIEDLRAWLLGYYGTSHVLNLLYMLQRDYPTECVDVGFLVPFFVTLDHQIAKEEIDIDEIDKKRLNLEFERYLNRDKRMAQDIVQAISQYDGAEGTLEVLKYILAFKSVQVRIARLKPILEQAGFENIALYEERLLSDQVGILRKTTINGYSIYVFRQPYFRALLDTGWKEWRESAAEYYTTIFEGVHKQGRIKDDPNLALEATPSKLAVDVLYREGEYFCKYAGNLDIGYALKFYGLERGGALRKWLQLCKSVIDNEENLWDLIEWKSDARRNPLRGWSQEVYPVQTFAPELVLTAGRLYWAIGDWETAKIILDEEWQRILEHLPPAPDHLTQRLCEIDSEIRATLAEMLYQVGNPGSWSLANSICLALRGQKSVSQHALYKTHLLLSLIRHYRSIGVGNDLAPYQFLRPDVSLDSLKSACELIPLTEFERFQALYTLADSLWQMLTLPYSKLPTRMNFDKIGRLEIDDGTSEDFKNTIKEFKKTLTVISEHYRSNKRKVLPRGRIGEGDLLFWEGVLFFLLARQFALTACVEFGRYAILKDDRDSKVEQRFNTYLKVVNQLEVFMRKVMYPDTPSQKFAEQVGRVEEIAYERMKNGGTIALRDERRARRISEGLYYTGWSDLVDQSHRRLRMAETVYRHLGYNQGMARAMSVRALIEYSFSESEQPEIIEHQNLVDDTPYAVYQPQEPKSFEVSPAWVDAFERFFRHANGELGYNLDLLRGYLIVGQWAVNNDLYRAVRNYQKATDWTQPDYLGLPVAYSGEVNFQIGHLIGNMEDIPFPENYVFDVLNEAASSMDSLDDNPSYVKKRIIADRKLTIHWWLAELYSRKAWSEKKPTLRQKLLRKTVSECNYVINRSRNNQGRIRYESLAQLVKGRALVTQSQLLDGFVEVEDALKSFSSENDSYNMLQCLTSLIQWGYYHHDAPGWSSCQERCAEEYWSLLIRVATSFMRNLSSLSPSKRLVLQRAGALIGQILASQSNESVLDKALSWLNAVFDIRASLGLYGAAILLDRDLRPTYERLGDTDGLEKHKERVLDAARRLDPSRERIPFSKIALILRSYTDTVFGDLEFASTKRECLENAQRALHLEPPEIDSAIRLIEQAREFINLNSPEEVDVDLLTLLLNVYYQEGNSSEAMEIKQNLTQVQSVIQSRDFLVLAEYCKLNDRDYIWALRIASKVAFPNQYSKKARLELRSVQAQSKKQEVYSSDIPEEVELVKVEEETAKDEKDHLLSKPSSEFDELDCYRLLRWLEIELRNFIGTSLSRLTPKWWKQRVPPDTRKNAEARKQQNERPYPGRAPQDLLLQEYLDFSDYAKIITMRLNWDEAFKPIFRSKDFVFVKFSEIQMARNDIAHMRELHSQDAELFVTNARQVLQSIIQYTASESVVQLIP